MPGRLSARRLEREAMAFCELHYFSPALQKQTAANIILPEGEGKTGPFCVFYLLHGLSDDHTIWERRTSIERYVADLPLIVVMPDGGKSFYCDEQEGLAWETAIVGNLVNYVDKMFPTRAKRAGRCIGGLSMGGYGALKLALKYPDMFCSAVSHSGAPCFAHRPLPVSTGNAWNREMARIVGENPQGGPEDIFTLAKKAMQLPAERRPAL